MLAWKLTESVAPVPGDMRTGYFPLSEAGRDVYGGLQLCFWYIERCVEEHCVVESREERHELIEVCSSVVKAFVVSVTATRSLYVKPSQTGLRTWVRMFCTGAHALLVLVAPNEDAARESAY